MITFEQAQAHIFSLPFSPTVETISILDAHQRILAEDILSQTPIPAWNNSAMDGYAAHIDDIQEGIALTVSQVIPAGATEVQTLARGTCVRIFTGAPVPDGANAVVMQENTEVDDDRVYFLKLPTLWKNIRRQGEEIASNALLLKQGTVLDATSIPLAIGAGIRTVNVWKWPTVGILATGDEIVDPTVSSNHDNPLALGQIWGTNTIALRLAFQDLGCPTVDCGIARDNIDSTISTFHRSIVEHECDIIVSTGGVSVGDFDVVHKALEQIPDCTVNMNFWKVRMKPGKPVAAGRIRYKHKDIPLFALPGNPVSALMGFYQFVRPFLLQSMGHPQPTLPTLQLPLGQDIHKRGTRLEFVRCWIHNVEGTLQVFPTPNQSSAWMSSFSDASVLLPVKPEVHHIPAGTIVTVQHLPKTATWPATWRT